MRHVTITAYGNEAEANHEDGDVWTITYPWGSERFEGSPDKVREHMERTLVRRLERRRVRHREQGE